MTPLEMNSIYGLAWLSFGVGHSFLASARAKRLFEAILSPYYRITYNAIASVHIIAVWLVGHWIFEGADSFKLPVEAGVALTSLSILGLILLVLALRRYDLGLLSGMAQIQNHKMGITEVSPEPLHVDGLHAYVRHPIYLGAYLMLWGNTQDLHGLTTAMWGTAYLIVGTIFEERSLAEIYGDAYRTYRDRVPSIIPWRGKAV